MPSKKLSHIPSSGPIDHPSGITSVSMSVHLGPFPIITSTTFPSDVPSEKPSTKFIHYRIQLVCQYWFHLFKLVTSQPMFQVFTQAVDQVMGLLSLQSCTLGSTLVYRSHKPQLSLPVPISIPFSCHFHHSTLLLIFNQQKLVFQTIVLVL